MTPGLPAFPAGSGKNSPVPAFDTLRPAESSDLPFLRELYRTFRLGDLAPLPWSMEEKHAFLDQQFNMQHRYYLTAFPHADFLIIEQNGTSVGRLYIDAGSPRWHIIDIGLLPEWRNRKLGRTLLRGIQNAARSDAGGSVFLHVEQANIRARALYQRLGFRLTGDTATHAGMEWP